jgi:hypothetical protein
VGKLERFCCWLPDGIRTLSVRQMHKLAQFPAQPQIIADSRENPRDFCERSLLGLGVQRKKCWR